MARKPDIQYVHQFYTPGSEARKVETKPAYRKAKTKLPKFLRQDKVKVFVDPVALCGLVVAVAMVILMAVSTFQYAAAVQEYNDMQDKVVTLRDTCAEKRHTYRSGYNLEEIRETALAIGMVPAADVETIVIHPQVPQPEPEPTAWDNFIWVLEGLFA